MVLERRAWPILAMMVLGAAGALALTTPRDNTRFVSAGSPRKAAATAGAGERQAARSASQSRVVRSDVASKAGNQSAGAAVAVARAAEPTQGGGAASHAGLTRNLFRPLAAAGKSQVLPPARLPLLPEDADGLLPLPDPSSPGGKRQRAYWQYVGTVQLDGVTYALVEEKKTKAGVYLREGDGFRGGRVRAVRPGFVIVAYGGKQYTMPKASGLEEAPTERSVGNVSVATAAPGATPSPPGTTPGADSRAQVPGGEPAGARPEGQPADPAAVGAMPVEGDGGRGNRRRRWFGGFGYPQQGQ